MKIYTVWGGKLEIFVTNGERATSIWHGPSEEIYISERIWSKITTPKNGEGPLQEKGSPSSIDYRTGNTFTLKSDILKRPEITYHPAEAIVAYARCLALFGPARWRLATGK